MELLLMLEITITEQQNDDMKCPLSNVVVIPGNMKLPILTSIRHREPATLVEHIGDRWMRTREEEEELWNISKSVTHTRLLIY